MNPLSALYGAVTGTRNLFYDKGWLQPRQLGRPVVSVGNLTAGGSGKTPFVITLGELLRERGIAVDVLSRGYGRQGEGVLAVTPTRDPLQVGDEPVLLARRLGVPIAVAAQRFNAGIFAESKYDTRLHLLDDGFQHRQLHRDFEIVLLSRRDLTDSLLPVGRLREPLAALRRADVVAIDESLTDSEATAALRNVLGEFMPRLWATRRRLFFEEPIPARPVAFCGIARPERFFAQLRQHGIVPAAELRFADHHVYTEADLKHLRRLAKESSADGFLSTEKDEVKLLWHPPLEGFAVARLQTGLQDPEMAMDFLLQTLTQRHAGWDR
jgi:tetraacyldisaccharide 4'-kinase